MGLRGLCERLKGRPHIDRLTPRGLKAAPDALVRGCLRGVVCFSRGGGGGRGGPPRKFGAPGGMSKGFLRCFDV
jgi:hypothetical protein